MSLKLSVTQFSHCLVRHPASSVTDGLRAIDVGAPKLLDVQAEHRAYIAAMKAAGVAVDILPALENFPDSIFVEDVALTFPNGAILLRPGAPSRRMETQHIAPDLNRHFDTIIELAKLYKHRPMFYILKVIARFWMTTPFSQRAA